MKAETTISAMCYSARDLVVAYLDARRYRHADPELAQWFGSKYRALSKVFGADVDRVVQNGDFALASIFESALKQHEVTRTPFDGMLEASAVIEELFDAHGRELRHLADRVRDELVQLMCMLVVRVEPRLADATCTSKQLRAAGFDDSQQAPDPIHYW